MLVTNTVILTTGKTAGTDNAPAVLILIFMMIYLCRENRLMTLYPL